MKTRILSFAVLTVLALGGLGCPSSGNLSKTEAGGVYLSITSFNGLPIQVSVNSVANGGFVQIEQAVCIHRDATAILWCLVPCAGREFSSVLHEYCLTTADAV